MIKKITFFILFLIQGICFAQSSVNIDSLKLALKNSPDSVKVLVAKSVSSHYEHTDFDSALFYSYVGLEASLRLKDNSLQADMLNRMGVIYMNKGAYPEAMRHYKKALQLYEAVGSNLGLAITHSNISILARERKDFEKALFHSFKAYSIDSISNDSIGMAIDLGNLGGIYLESGQLQEAMVTFLKAIPIQKKLGMEVELARNYNNISDYYFTVGQYDSAKHYINLSIASKSARKDEYGLANSTLNVGLIELKLKEYDAALTQIREAERLATNLNMANLQSKILEAYSQYYSGINDKTRALSFYKQFKALNDSLFNETKSRQISELEIQYETAQKAREIERLTANARHQQRLIKIGVVFIMLVLILFVLVYNRARLKNALLKKDSLLEAEKMQRLQDEIDARNRELVSDTMHVIRKNELLENVKEKLKDVSKKHDVVKKELREVVQLVHSNINFEKEWEDLKIHFEQVHPRFFEAITERFPDLTQHDLKHCAYIKLNLSNKEVARMLNVDAKSVRMSHYRLKKKLNLSTDDDLHEFVKNF